MVLDLTSQRLNTPLEGGFQYVAVGHAASNLTVQAHSLHCRICTQSAMNKADQSSNPEACSHLQNAVHPRKCFHFADRDFALHLFCRKRFRINTAPPNSVLASSRAVFIGEKLSLERNSFERCKVSKVPRLSPSDGHAAHQRSTVAT